MAPEATDAENNPRRTSPDLPTRRAALLAAAGLLILAAAALGLRAASGNHPLPPPAERSHRVPINHADAQTLQLLPQIGPARAQAIILERQQAGPFRNPDDLTRVNGIAEKRAAALAPHVRFDPDPD